MSCLLTMTSASFLPLTRSHCWVTSWMASVAWVCISWQQDPDVVLKKQNYLLRNVSLPQQYHPAVTCLRSLLSDCPGQLHIPFDPTGNDSSSPPLPSPSQASNRLLSLLCVCVCDVCTCMCVCLFMYVSVGIRVTQCVHIGQRMAKGVNLCLLSCLGQDLLLVHC